MQGVVKAGYVYVRDLAATMLELPYNGLDYSMVIALPQNGSSVEVLKRQLNGTVIVASRQKLREARIKLHLPRFKLEQKYDLKKVLPKLGIKRMFNAGEADLSRINGDKSLFVDQVMHEAVVEVNEEGSEAAAVTGVTINTRTITGPHEIHVDRPFLFFIDNKRTGNVLFVGQVNKIE
uniref:Serpin B n=1 Tax=Rhipicephalus appendiculatus TaxID=34631 RepID=A0A131YJ16_RHIAP